MQIRTSEWNVDLGGGGEGHPLWLTTTGGNFTEVYYLWLSGRVRKGRGEESGRKKQHEPDQPRVPS